MTRDVAPTARLAILVEGTRLHCGILLALAAQGRCGSRKVVAAALGVPYDKGHR